MKNPLNQFFITCFCTVSLSACVSTSPSLGGSSGNTITGAAGGAQSQGENKALERCEAPLGTLSIYEDTNENWWYDYRRIPPIGHNRAAHTCHDSAVKLLRHC